MNPAAGAKKNFEQAGNWPSMANRILVIVWFQSGQNRKGAV